jgi:hypothetical protein
MDYAICERRIGAGSHGEVQCCPLHCCRSSRVRDDQRASVSLLSFEVPHDRRHRFRGVAADEQDHVGMRNVFEWKWQAAIDAERLRRTRGRRRHAEAPVVVDARRAKRHARKLPQQVRLLVCERPSAENANRIATVSRLRRPNGGRDAIDRCFPRDRFEISVLGARARRKQTFWMAQCRGRGPPLYAQATFIDGKFFVALNSDVIAVANHVHSALKRAVRAMRRYQS